MTQKLIEIAKDFGYGAVITAGMVAVMYAVIQLITLFDYTKEQSEEGYKNFAVIQCKIKSIEWLYLAAKGHRRAKFDLESNKDTWLVP